MTVFVDSSALFAAANQRDRSNERARALLASGEPLLTTDHVLVETWLLSNARLGMTVADAIWQGVRRSTSIEPVIAADLDAAWEIGRAYPDQSFSIVDRTSFAVMERLGIYRVVTFDNDFAIYRFGAGSRLAFEILR